MSLTKQEVRMSRAISRFLRHEPAAIGIVLGVGGYVAVDDLLAGMRRKGMQLDRNQLEQIVAENDKQRFSFSQDGKRIRANQGHSTTVDMNFSNVDPPDCLFHGTAHQNVSSILRDGLKPMKRQHVHMSRDKETAKNVGQRHGKPVVLLISACQMHERGYKFFCSDNNVWLTEFVPPEFINVDYSYDPYATDEV